MPGPRSEDAAMTPQCGFGSEGAAIRFDAKVDLPKALRFLGHRGQVMDYALSARAEEAANLCNREVSPSGVFRVFDVGELGESKVALRGTSLVLPGHDISKRLKGCVACACFAVTLGAASEMLLKRQSSYDALDGMLADACASSMVEMAAEEMNELISIEAGKVGMDCVPRYSPGYGDMDLDVQQPFLDALDAGRLLGLCTSSASMLIPRKSITAVVGLLDR